MNTKAWKLMEPTNVPIDRDLRELNPEGWAHILPEATVQLILAGEDVRVLRLPFLCRRCRTPMKLVTEYEEHYARKCEQLGMAIEKKAAKKARKHAARNTRN